VARHRGRVVELREHIDELKERAPQPLIAQRFGKQNAAQAPRAKERRTRAQGRRIKRASGLADGVFERILRHVHVENYAKPLSHKAIGMLRRNVQREHPLQ
jgi:hypothetical protein